LEMGREKRTRALLAEIGIPPESAAVTKKAVTEALMQHMPAMKGLAMSLQELCDAGGVVTIQTAKVAVKELLAAGTIERTGTGKRNDPYRYFAKR
jgi:predicted MarR family transcription regulator